MSWSDIIKKIVEFIKKILGDDTTTTTTGTNTDTTTTPNGNYVYVDGDLRDKGGEIYNPNFCGMDIRLSANDKNHLHPAGIPCKGSWYPLDGSVLPKGAVELGVASDGGIIASFTDAISNRTGKKYHCVGYFVQSDSTPLRKENPITVPKSECKKTLRFALVTVA